MVTGTCPLETQVNVLESFIWEHEKEVDEPEGWSRWNKVTLSKYNSKYTVLSPSEAQSVSFYLPSPNKW